MTRPPSREELKKQIEEATRREAQPRKLPGRPTVAEEAAVLIEGPRADHYGDPVKNHRDIGKVWAILLDLPEPISPRTVAVMMAALKLVREGGPRRKRDNLVDACGYILIAERAEEAE